MSWGLRLGGWLVSTVNAAAFPAKRLSGEANQIRTWLSQNGNRHRAQAIDVSGWVL